MRSMTGYGRGEASTHGIRLVVELHALNRKHTDIALSLPRPLLSLEGRLREIIQTRIGRGRINANINVLPSKDTPPAQLIDVELAALYAASMRQLQARLQLGGDITLESVLRAPGVLLAPCQEVNPDAVLPLLEQALHEALNSLITMREAEGTALRSDILARIATLKQCALAIRVRAPEVLEAHRTTLLERIRAAGVELEAEPERLLRELALFADRSDISEELTRLESHFAQMDKHLSQNGPVGRTLEFLTQEIGRELNTLGVKSNDVSISHWIVSAKAELEKIREQVQNIE